MRRWKIGRSCPHSVLHMRRARECGSLYPDSFLTHDYPRVHPQGLFSHLMAPLVSSPGMMQAMSWVLLLLLSAGNPAGSYRKRYFGIMQPVRLSGVQGGSIKIPFSYFPWELAWDSEMTILWRRKHFHGELIYNSSSGFIHEHFKDRLVLNWAQPQTSGALRILDLKEKDQTVYFCQVHLHTKHGREIWQSLHGTRLTITHAARTITKSPSIVTSAVTTAGLEDTEDQRNPSLVNLGATFGVVVATAVLITPVYVMLIFLWWKKSCRQTMTSCEWKDQGNSSCSVHEAGCLSCSAGILKTEMNV